MSGKLVHVVTDGPGTNHEITPNHSKDRRNSTGGRNPLPELAQRLNVGKSAPQRKNFSRAKYSIQENP